MFQPTMRKMAITCLLVLLLTPLLALNGDWIWSQPSDGSIHLEAPPFFNTAQAQGTTFADTEAGIAAYFNAGQQINLSNTALQSLYRSPVTPTGNYLLGSARISDNNTNTALSYDDNDDAQLYISQDGWVMAYYHRTAPTSKMFDWLNWNGGGNLPTTLGQVLKDAASQLSASQPTPTYYHFAFPDANRMILIADQFDTNIVDTNSFNVDLSSSFEYFESSWSLGSFRNLTYDGLTYTLNNTDIGQVSYGIRKYEKFTGAQVLIGSRNTVTIKAESICCGAPLGMGGLAIVYKVP